MHVVEESDSSPSPSSSPSPPLKHVSWLRKWSNLIVINRARIHPVPYSGVFLGEGVSCSMHMLQPFQKPEMFSRNAETLLMLASEYRKASTENRLPPVEMLLRLYRYLIERCRRSDLKLENPYSGQPRQGLLFKSQTSPQNIILRPNFMLPRVLKLPEDV